MAYRQYLSMGGIVVSEDPVEHDYERPAASAVFDVYDAYTGGTQVTDLQDMSSGAITQVTVPVNTIPVFKAQDTLGTLFLQDTGNPTAQRIPAIPANIASITGTGAVSSVAGKTGAVTLVATDVSDSTSTGQGLMTAASASAARTTLGATTAGAAVFTAASTSAAQDAIGATTTGKALVTAADAAAVRTAAGATTTGNAAITAANADALATAAGGTTTGKALLTTASAVAARTTISAPSQSETDLKIKAIVGSTAFGLGRGPLASRPAPGTSGLNDGDLWLETS